MQHIPNGKGHTHDIVQGHRATVGMSYNGSTWHLTVLTWKFGTVQRYKGLPLRTCFYALRVGIS